MKKIKKILVGTHNQGKFKEISYLLGKLIKKISPVSLPARLPWTANQDRRAGRNYHGAQRRHRENADHERQPLRRGHQGRVRRLEEAHLGDCRRS